jgi:transcriptional regulator with XRE-family HTH domain
VRRWRQERGLTQEVLARSARIPRPNLSRIESGQAEVSLRTIRALASALSIPAGVLVDGQSPTSGDPLSRAALERIATAAVQGKDLSAPHEQALAIHLRSLLGPRLRAMGRRVPGPRRFTRRSQAAWLALSDHAPEVAKSLLQRALERAQT